jgi:hypothetical protein
VPALLSATQPDLFRQERVERFRKASVEAAGQNGAPKVYPPADYYRELFAQKREESPPQSPSLPYWQRQWQELMVFIKHLT